LSINIIADCSFVALESVDIGVSRPALLFINSTINRVLEEK